MITADAPARDKRRPYGMAEILAVYTANGGLCGLCAGPVSPAEASIDHITPLAAGGRHVPTNWQLAHRRCNSSKGAGPRPARPARPAAGPRQRPETAAWIGQESRPRNRLEETRLARGESLRHVARAVHMDATQLSKIERGMVGCGDDKKVALAKHFDVGVGPLFFEEAAS